MPSAQEVYRHTVSRLSSEDRLQLAALILSDLAAARPAAEGRHPVLELINSFPAGRGFKTPAAADEYLRAERDSWER